MDTPWLHVYTAHKLSLLQQRTFRLTSELTTSKWLSVRNLLLEAFLVDGSREKEARLKLYTPAVTYIKVRRARLRGFTFLVFKRSSGLENVICSLPGGRLGRRREAKYQSLGIVGHAVDAADQRKHLSGGLETKPHPTRGLRLWKTQPQSLRRSEQRGQGERRQPVCGGGLLIFYVFNWP